jgi:hypothetical protein
MPDKWPLANGNWSNAANWNGGTKPVLGDDVFADGRTVTIDEDVNVGSIRTTQRSGGTNSGGFTLTGNRTITVTGSIGIQAGGSACLLINSVSTVNIAGNVNGGNANNAWGVNITAAVILNVVGNVRGSNLGGASAWAYGIHVQASSTVVNVTGTVQGGPQEGSNTLPTHAIHAIAQCAITVTGNVLGSISGTISAPAVTAGVSLATNSCSLTVIGNVTATIGTAITSTNNVTINVSGNITATAASYAVLSTNVSSTNIISGNLNNVSGMMAVFAAKLFLGNSGAQYWDFTTSNLLVNRRLYTADTLPGVPAIANVRQSTVYGASNELTGTLVVPIPANVRRGVATDNTVGTADLTAADMWNHLLTSITTDGSVGKLIKDSLDAAVSTRLAAAGYTAPDNAGVTAIKAKTDNLPSDPASDTNVNAVAQDVWSSEIETGYDAKETMRIVSSVLAGKVSGAGSGTETFRDVNDTTDRVVAIVDNNGNRTGITIDVS